MTDFKRARTSEQRSLRLSELRSAARALLADASADEVSLRSIATQAGLAPSGVLRYAGSREELLLDVMDQEYRAWIAELDEMFDGPLPVDTIAAAIATTLVARPVLFGLIEASPSLLRVLPAGTRALEQGLHNQAEFARVLDRALAVRLTAEHQALLVAGLHAIVAGAAGWSRQAVFVSTADSAVRELFALLLEGLRSRAATP